MVRIAEKQVEFREANGQIEVAADRMDLAGQVPFIYECAEESCTEIVQLSIEAYEEVRQHPRRFFNALGYDALSVASGAAVVVAGRSGYVLVEKIDLAGEIAEEQYEKLDERDADE